MDGLILLFIQDVIRNPVLTPVIIAITSLGDGAAVWVVLSVLLLIPKQTRKIGIMSLAALLGSLLVNNLLIKNIAGRARPYDVIEGLIPLVGKPADYSFPSGHTGSSFSSACILYRKLPKQFGIPALILAGLIGLSRLYVGVHYPTDVLFGMLSGIGVSYLAEMAVDCGYRKFDEKKER